MQSTGAAYMSTAGGMLTRDLLKHFMMPNASHGAQKFWGRIGVGVIVLAALVVATTSKDALVLLGGLAVAYGFQMWPSLMAVCWFPWLTRQGCTIGLIAGLVAVTATETVGQNLGITAWGRWPLTIHSAGWGILFNLGLAIIISAMTQNEGEHQPPHEVPQASCVNTHRCRRPRRAWCRSRGSSRWCGSSSGSDRAPSSVTRSSVTRTISPPGPSACPPSGPGRYFGGHSAWCMMWFLAYKMELSTVPGKGSRIASRRHRRCPRSNRRALRPVTVQGEALPPPRAGRL